MSLPTVDDLRDYLRIEHTAEDALLDRLLAQARAAVEAYIRQPIEARAQSFTVVPEKTYAGGVAYGYTMRLVLPYAPVANPIVVLDGTGETVVADDYTVVADLGWINSAEYTQFGLGPYRITATVGLSLRDDYETAVEPVMSSAIIDWAADLYQRRNPAASYESGGGGVATNYNETASKTMPSRIRVTLDTWRRVLV